MRKDYDLIVIGSGAAGIIAAITASRENKDVLVLEKLSRIAAKLKATGGGRCNLTNTLSNEEFMTRFGREGRFMQDALGAFDHNNLRDFFKEIGVETHAPDGFRVFPTSHSSVTIINALQKEMQRLDIELKTNEKVTEILHAEGSVIGVKTQNDTYSATNVVVATGGLGYPILGATGDGHGMAKSLGHKITRLSPAMMPLLTKERWVENCRANTIPRVQLRVNIKKHKKLRAFGDLIFTKNGIRGPVVLDFAREITPLLEKYGEVPLLLNLTKGMDENDILQHIKKEQSKNPHADILELLISLLPEALCIELCKLSGVNPHTALKEIEGRSKDNLIKTLAWTPLTINGHEGFEKAMITRGGIDLKEIEPKTMQSRLIRGIYFCGEIMNLDGPCGGYNLQWSFASGVLAGRLKS